MPNSGLSLDGFIAALGHADVRQVFCDQEEHQKFWEGIEAGTKSQAEEYDRARRESNQIRNFQ